LELPSYFKDFLKEIRPTQNQRNDLITGSRTLRKRLLEDEVLASIIVNTFLQGSHRRATAIRPKNDKRSDVDVVVVTKLSQDEYTPEAAMDVFVPFLDRHYQGKWEFQGRSMGITLSYVDLDLVITSAPTESEIGILESDSVTSEDTPEDVGDWRLNKSWVSLEHRMQANAMRRLKESAQEPEWKLNPLYIPDRDAQRWEPTHPLEQISWTWGKNQACNTHYVNVVKALKWWRRVQHTTPKYPKGYPVEHLIGYCCPDGITSIAEGVTLTLENIVSRFRIHASLKSTPDLRDHGVPSHNVFKRVSGEDFAQFYEQVKEAAQIARLAYNAETVKESADAWRELFGEKFPEAPDTKENSGSGGQNSGGYTPRATVSTVGGGRFA